MHALEILRTRAPPGTDSGNDRFSHRGEECVIILKGAMELRLGSRAYSLEAGDALYFDSIIPHSWKNTGEGDLEAMWVITPPHY